MLLANSPWVNKTYLSYYCNVRQVTILNSFLKKNVVAFRLKIIV